MFLQVPFNKYVKELSCVNSLSRSIGVLKIFCIEESLEPAITAPPLMRGEGDQRQLVEG